MQAIDFQEYITFLNLPLVMIEFVDGFLNTLDHGQYRFQPTW